MQLDTTRVENAPTNAANPVSPGSPFSAKQRKWSGVVQQVQDSSARLDLRRRQSTEAATAGTSLLLHMQPSSTAQRTGAAAPGLHSMRSQFAAPKGSLARRAAAEAAPGSVHQQAGARNCSDSSSNCPLQTPAARDKGSVRSPQRFTSLKQRLREVKRARQHKNSSRASSVLTDNTDNSRVVSEGSSIVEAKLEQLLLQVSGDPSTAHASVGLSQRRQLTYVKADSTVNSGSSRGDRLNPGGLLSQAAGSKQQQPACAVQKGLGVIVRRFKPPTSTSTMAPLPAGGIPFSASSPSLTAAAAAAAGTPTAAVATTAPGAAAAAAAYDGTPASVPAASRMGMPASSPDLASLTAGSIQQAAHAAGPASMQPVPCDTPEQQHSASTHSSGSSASYGSSARQGCADAHAAYSTAGSAHSFIGFVQLMQQPMILSPAWSAPVEQQVLQAQPHHQAASPSPGAAPIVLDAAQRSASGLLNSSAALLSLPAAAVPAAGLLLPAVGAAASPWADKPAQEPVTQPSDNAAGQILKLSLAQQGPDPLRVAGGASNNGASCSRRPSLLLTPPDAAATHLGMPMPVLGWAGDSPSSSAVCTVGSSTMGPGSYVLQRNSAAASTSATAAGIAAAATAAAAGAPAGCADAQQAAVSCNSVLGCGSSSGPEHQQPAGQQQLQLLLQGSAPLLLQPGSSRRLSLQLTHPSLTLHTAPMASAAPGAAAAAALPAAVAGPSPPAPAVTTVAAAVANSAGPVTSSAAVGGQTVTGTVPSSMTAARAQHNPAQLLAGRSVLQCSYSGAADVFNDADIQQLLRKVAACVGPDCGHAAVAAGTAPASAAGALSSACTGEAAAAAAAVPAARVFSNVAGGTNHSVSAYADHGILASRALDPAAEATTAAATAAGAAAASPGVSCSDSDSHGLGSCPTRRQFKRHVSWKAEVDVLDLDAESEQWRPTTEQAAGAGAGAAAAVPPRQAASEAVRPVELAVLPPGDSTQLPGSTVSASTAALVVPLSLAALALAAGLEKQQQRLEQAREFREASLSGSTQGHGHPHSKAQPASGRLSAGPAAVQGHVLGSHDRDRTVASGFGGKPGFRVQQAESIAGTADGVSSCCGSSELSAMANPVAYADRLTQRMAQHLGGAVGSSELGRGMGASASAAADGQSEHVFESGSPSTAVNLLERYLNGHQGQKQKAARLEQNLKQRNQMRSQREQQVLVQQSVAQLQHAFSPLGQPSQWQGTASPSPLHGMPPTRMVAGTHGQLQEHSHKLLGAKAGVISSKEVDQECQVNVDKLKQDLALVLRRV